MAVSSARTASDLTAAALSHMTDRPRQQRSTASTERMLAVAESLLSKHGERFTLNEVAKTGKLSMSSVYARFTSKGALVRAVQAQVLADMARAIDAGLKRIAAQDVSLRQTIADIVELYADTHRQRAHLIGTFRLASRYDPELRAAGVAFFAQLRALASSAILEHQSGIEAPEARRMVENVVGVMLYALMAHLGSGDDQDIPEKQSWSDLQSCLGSMMFAALSSACR